MGMWKNGMTTEQIARKVLRNYLVRCHRIISEDYSELSKMSPDESADYLLHLRDTGRIDITLYEKSRHQVGCKITELGPKIDG